MSTQLEVILKHMCDVVNCEYNTIDFKSDDWYMKYSWTEEQQSEFIEWLTHYLKNSSSARKELMSNPSKSVKILRDVSSFFVSMYGWKVTTN